MAQAFQVFSDLSGFRKTLLRKTFCLGALVAVAVLVTFFARMLRPCQAPRVPLPVQYRPYRPLNIAERAVASSFQNKNLEDSENDSGRRLLQPRLDNQAGVAVRGAFYIPRDTAAYSSLHQYLRQLDLLFPEWLHVLGADGRLQAVWSSGVDESDAPKEVFFDVIQHGHVQSVDSKVMALVAAQQAETQVLPMVNNFDPLERRWIPDVSKFFADADARARFRRQIMAFLRTNSYAGLTLDFEEFSSSANAAYVEVVKELASDLHAGGLKLYVVVPATDEDYPYTDIAANSDRVILMNQDQHSPEDLPGPIASQNWFWENLHAALASIPPEKLISSIGNYGYDWTFEQQAVDGQPQAALKEVRSITTQAAWLAALDSKAPIEFDSKSLNLHVSFIEEPNLRHEIWYTDAITALNQMRSAQQQGVNAFALWCLGTEDRSLWSVWRHPESPDAPNEIRKIPPGFEVERYGKGEILTIKARPSPGTRTLAVDSSSDLVTQEQLQQTPIPYEVGFYGAASKQVAITFDDGPDSRWTAPILDVLKAEHVPATFFMIGSQAARYPALTKRVYNEGHEIGNHTWSHPDFSSASKQRVRMELNMAERLFATEFGFKTALFRSPYAVTEDPGTADQVLLLDIAQELGYIAVGNNIDPHDWQPFPKPSAEQVSASVISQLSKGNIILLHDGGGDRHETVRALPMIIHELRARGYQIVPLCQLLGKSTAEVMPTIPPSKSWLRCFDSFGFHFYAIVYAASLLIFVLGDSLMGMRVLSVGTLAILHRLRRWMNSTAGPDYKPEVAVLIPAYNEEKVIVHTVRSVLAADYHNVRIIVIDDGSTDGTLSTVRAVFVGDARVTVLTKPNGGKASALNYGLRHVRQDIFFGLDADTQVDPKAIGLMVAHFADANVAAVAGNAKVGNCVNLWTRLQALEYLTSQNLERRALDAFGAVTVVPGAIGAWRTAAVREAGCYHPDTVAEDADLTMTLLQRGYCIRYEDRAHAYTEAPDNLRSLMKQRLRWSFGILQSAWKHRAVFMRKGVLGWIGLPNILLFQIFLPLVSPLIDLIFLFGLTANLLDLRFHLHPAEAQYGDLTKLLVLFVAFLSIDFISSGLALALERGRLREREGFRLLWHVFLQRFAYRQLLSLVILRTLKHAAEGHSLAWNKLERTATVRSIHSEMPLPTATPLSAFSGSSEAA